MKLRSGKVLPIRIDRLPADLDNLLEIRLQEFKTLFSGNPQHAKELLHIISKSVSINARFDIREKIKEIYDVNEVGKIASLMSGAGELACLLIYNPQCHEIIEKRMKNYDLESPLLGDIEDNM